MKEIEVEGLLARFMNGETSVEEETALADYFQHATDEDKPAGMPYVDWAAYREMFRQFDEGFEDVEYMARHVKSRLSATCKRQGKAKIGRHGYLWLGMSAAAVAALVVMVLTLGRGSGKVAPTVAEAPDSVSSITLPVDTVVERSDNADIPPTPSQKAKPKKQRRLPYTLPVPRPLLAEAVSSEQRADGSEQRAVSSELKAQGSRLTAQGRDTCTIALSQVATPDARSKALEAEAASEDSMAVALEEAERLINAMIVYQEIMINEICNVEFEEEY